MKISFLYISTVKGFSAIKLVYGNPYLFRLANSNCLNYHKTKNYEIFDRQKNFQQKSRVPSIEFFFPLKRCPVRRPLSNDLIWTRTETFTLQRYLPSCRKSISAATASFSDKVQLYVWWWWWLWRCTISLKPSVTLSPSLRCRNFHISKKFNPRSIVRQKPFVKFCQIGDSSSNLKGEMCQECWVG